MCLELSMSCFWSGVQTSCGQSGFLESAVMPANVPVATATPATPMPTQPQVRVELVLCAGAGGAGAGSAAGLAPSPADAGGTAAAVAPPSGNKLTVSVWRSACCSVTSASLLS